MSDMMFSWSKFGKMSSWSKFRGKLLAFVVVLETFGDAFCMGARADVDLRSKARFFKHEEVDSPFSLDVRGQGFEVGNSRWYRCFEDLE